MPQEYFPPRGGIRNVLEDGVIIVTPARELNFTNTGVVVTDQGGGRAGVDIAGGGSGTSDEIVGELAFAFNTPTTVLMALLAGQVFLGASILIVTAFDDPAAELLLGTGADDSRFLGIANVDPTDEDAEFQTRAIDPITSGDDLVLTINPGASTQGAGLLVYRVRR